MESKIDVLLCINITQHVLNDGPTYCINARETIKKISQISNTARATIVINDRHAETDIELKYLPPHALTNLDTYTPLWFASNCRNLQVLTKSAPSGINTHTLETLKKLKPKNITIAGFAASIDVLATCYDLITNFENVRIYEELIGDMSQEMKSKAVDVIKWMGITNVGLSQLV